MGKPGALPGRIVRAPQFELERIDGKGTAPLVDQDHDGTETYLVGSDVRTECKRCGKWKIHDVFGEVAGDAAGGRVAVRFVLHCRDCGHETHSDAEGYSPVGDVSVKIQRSPQSGQRDKARAARKARRKQR
ncbi:MAG: hypothetical protein OEZ01_00595 [Candidatus Heimdallarchaeota archaeon]|nr:hypothetical protein [Candidatus Heimdallarchaeota archaeon]MDH5676606.1 hypothetical protein [Myxococcales bacterium]